MKSPTLDEMKLAVAGMLPDEIKIQKGFYFGGITKFSWRTVHGPDVGEYSWLHVCHLAEKTLTVEQADEFEDAVKRSLNYDTPPDCAANEHFWHLDLPVRMQAICRVRCPEMFQ